MDSQARLLVALERHEAYLGRAARMLSAGARGDELPPDALFHEEELKSLQKELQDLAVELTGQECLQREVWEDPVSFAYHHGYLTKDQDELTWLRDFHRGLAVSKRFFQAFVRHTGAVHHGDIYHVNRGIVVTGHARVRDVTLNASDHDCDALAMELATLRNAMRNESKTAEDDIDVARVAEAEIAARDGNLDGAMAHLKDVGKWCVDLAAKIGVDVATAALKSAIGLGG